MVSLCPEESISKPLPPAPYVLSPSVIVLGPWSPTTIVIPFAPDRFWEWGKSWAPVVYSQVTPPGFGGYL